MFKILELVMFSENLEDVYLYVYEIIKIIIYVDNLYIVLYDENINWLSFLYCVDEYNNNVKLCLFVKGYSELVLSIEKC